MPAPKPADASQATVTVKPRSRMCRRCQQRWAQELGLCRACARETMTPEAEAQRADARARWNALGAETTEQPAAAIPASPAQTVPRPALRQSPAVAQPGESWWTKQEAQADRATFHQTREAELARMKTSRFARPTWQPLE